MTNSERLNKVRIFGSGATSVLIVVVILTSFVVYFNALFNGFVYDDDLQVLENPWIKNIRNIPRMLFSNVWDFKTGPSRLISNYYRPMMHIMYLLNYNLFGFNALGFHFVNIIFHAGNCVLVFLISSELLKESALNLPSPLFATSNSRIPLSKGAIKEGLLSPTFISAMLFATHPIHTEAVTWVAGLPEVSFAFFFLLSLYSYTRSVPGEGGNYFSILFFVLSILCKETGLVLPAVLIAYDYLLRKEKVFSSRSLKRYLPYFVVIGAYLVMRFYALGSIAPFRQHEELNAYQLIINSFPLFSEYLGKLLLPVNLSAFHVLHPIHTLFEPKGMFSIFVASTFAGLGFFALKKNRILFFSLVFLVLPLLPVLYIPGVGENSFAERYLYLPSFGFVIAAGFLVKTVSRRTFALGAVLLLIIVFYSVGTIERNTVWKDNYRLWTDTVEKSPDGGIPHQNLAKVFLDMGRIEDALAESRIALQLQPDFDSHFNMGIALGRKGLIDQSIEEYKAALALNPYFSEAHNNLGLAYMKKGMIDQAIEQYRNTLEINPDYAGAHNNLGIAYMQKRWIDEAIEQFYAVVKLQPDNASAHHNLGVAYREKGLPDSALEHFEAAVRLEPGSPVFRGDLEKAYAESASVGSGFQKK